MNRPMAAPGYEFWGGAKNGRPRPIPIFRFADKKLWDTRMGILAKGAAMSIDKRALNNYAEGHVRGTRLSIFSPRI